MSRKSRIRSKSKHDELMKQLDRTVLISKLQSDLDWAIEVIEGLVARDCRVEEDGCSVLDPMGSGSYEQALEFLEWKGKVRKVRDGLRPLWEWAIRDDYGDDDE